jgi:hypothetical protein
MVEDRTHTGASVSWARRHVVLVLAGMRPKNVAFFGARFSSSTAG